METEWQITSVRPTHCMTKHYRLPLTAYLETLIFLSQGTPPIFPAIGQYLLNLYPGFIAELFKCRAHKQHIIKLIHL